MDHPGVNDVAVIGVYDEQQQTEVPRAFVVASQGKTSEKDGEKIINWLGERVASHKRLRGGVRFIDQVPKSAAGKILRRLLKDKAKEEELQNGTKAKL